MRQWTTSTARRAAADNLPKPNRRTRGQVRRADGRNGGSEWLIFVLREGS